MADSTPAPPRPFRSSGTLHADFGDTIGRLRKVLFVPDADHTVRHRGGTLAVFLSAAAADEARAIELSEGPIEISPPASPDPVLLQALKQAALRQSGVDIEVDFRDPHDLSLLALTVPAVSHRK